MYNLIRGWVLLDSFDDLLTSLRGELSNGLEGHSAGDSRDVGERLENIGEGGVIAVVEQDHRCQSRVSGNQSRHNVGLGIIDVGCVFSGSLKRSVVFLNGLGCELTYRKEAVDILSRHSPSASPHLARRNGLHVKAGDQTEVAATSLQGPEQVRVVLGVGLDNSAVGQDNLVVDNSSASKTDLVTVEVDTSGEKQTGNTDGAETATCGSQVVLAKVSIDILPSVGVS